MPTKRTVSSKSQAASSAASSSSDGVVTALQERIASLEAQIEKLASALSAHEAQSAKEHKILKDACDACCAAKSSGGKDAELRSELKQYFATVTSTKIRTHIPKID
tara:strand:+ start:37 stop:354 length:318 start_codon:yes stop_codon:yes gene_type:complete